MKLCRVIFIRFLRNSINPHDLSNRGKIAYNTQNHLIRLNHTKAPAETIAESNTMRIKA